MLNLVGHEKRLYLILGNTLKRIPVPLTGGLFKAYIENNCEFCWQHIVCFDGLSI